MKLRPYQIEGAHWLAGRSRAYLGDKPRVGKTPTIAEGLRLANATSALIVCPAKVRTHWRNIMREVAPNVPHEVMSWDKIVDGGVEMREILLRQTDISHLVLDEAHHLSANAAGKVAMRARLLLGKDGYAHRIPVVWLASGTPMLRHPGSLWIVMAAVFGSYLKPLGIKTADDWYNRFTSYTWEPSQYGPPERRVWGGKNEGELTALLQQIMLRRSLEDTGMEVPPLSWVPLTVDVPLDLGMEPNELLGASRLIREWIDGKVDEITETPALGRLRHDLGLAKVPGVVEYVRETILQADEQVAIFAHHLDVLDALEKELPDSVRVDGSVSDKRAWRHIEAFNNGSVPVFLGQNHAVKEGIPLHAANTALLVEPDWVAVVNHQLSQRIVAVGQSTPKTVMMVATANSIDEAIVRQHIRETEMQEVLG